MTYYGTGIDSSKKPAIFQVIMEYVDGFESKTNLRMIIVEDCFILEEVCRNIFRNSDDFRKHRLEIILGNYWKVFNIYMKIIFYIGILNQRIFWLIQEGRTNKDDFDILLEIFVLKGN